MTDAIRPHHKIWPKRLPRELVVPKTSLFFNLEVAAARYPDKPAHIFFGQAMSYAQLKAQAEALAGWLQSAGVGKGDRVALYMQNCPQFIVAVYGILRADAVVVPVNPMNRADEFSHYITDPQSKAVICSADLSGFVATANAALPLAERVPQVLVTRYTDTMPDGALDPMEAPSALLETWLRAEHPLPAGFTRWTDALGAARKPGPHTAGPDDLALLPYTSGTTGLPKGCMHTHATLGPRARRALAVALQGDALDGDPDDGHRPVRKSQLQELRPEQPAQHRRRRCGHAARGGAAIA